MADNVQTNFGQFATDDVGGGVQVQFIKLMDGTLDSTQKITGDTANGLDVDVTRVGGAGATPYRNLDLGVTGQVLKASAGKLVLLVATNQHASAKRYLKIYNKASAPTQSDTPVMTVPLTAGVTLSLIDDVAGVSFAAGISMRASTAIADSDTGAPTANDVVVNAAYV
jgi:hypothetical protein